MGKIKGCKLPIIRISVERVSCECIRAYIWAGRKHSEPLEYSITSVSEIGKAVQQYIDQNLSKEADEIEQDNGVEYLTDEQVKNLVKEKGKQNDTNDR